MNRDDILSHVDTVVTYKNLDDVAFDVTVKMGIEESFLGYNIVRDTLKGVVSSPEGVSPSDDGVRNGTDSSFDFWRLLLFIVVCTFLSISIVALLLELFQ